VPWVRFTGDFDWSPPERGGRVTIAYRAGMVLLVTTACATAAAAADRAQHTMRPARSRDDERE
jgi:hypothetical protein